MNQFIDIRSGYFECSTKNMQNLCYHDIKHGRDDRFIKNGARILAHAEYKAPHAGELGELYFKALECARSERELARYIAKNTGKSENAVYFWLRAFKFKNPLFCKKVKELLFKFIKENNLFWEQEL